MVDETVIQLDDEQYWLYAAVDPNSNNLLHTTLEPTRTNVIADQVFTELREKHDVDDAIFLVDGAVPLHRACDKHDIDFRYVLLDGQANAGLCPAFAVLVTLVPCDRLSVRAQQPE